MTKQEAREIFNQAAAVAAAKGDADAVSRIELAREYFTNPAFRVAMQDHSFKTTFERAVRG